ncbi:MAG: type II toxin-antitoxin system RelE/ParE family toxin [Gammaproteobacteria bacterium]|nr:type II toxin-antitoxin system RelE/ParE family toxin [Gammaproteobacteria bacterium]
MGSYKLSEDAKADLIRIHQHGIRRFGEAQGDKYYYALVDRFEQLAEQPLLYQAVDEFRKGYRRSVCGVDSIYYRIDGDVVEIMAIIGQQDADKWL